MQRTISPIAASRSRRAWTRLTWRSGITISQVGSRPIVSNSWRVLLDLLLANIDFPVDLTVSSSEVERPKPDPEPYVRACELLGADPVRSIVVEDSPTGAAAGLAAGSRVLAVGAAVQALDDPRLHHVDTLEGVGLDALADLVGGDRVEDPKA